jgi:hypothetical protein
MYSSKSKTDNMKKLILFLALITIILPASQAQDSLKAKPNLSKAPENDFPNHPTHNQDYYLKKSSRMNTAGLVLLGLGSALTIGGVIVYNDAMNSENWGDGLVNGAGGYLAIVAGSAMVITSIPVLIVAGHNKKKAMELSSSIQLQPYQQIREVSLATNWVPSLSLKLRLP